MLSSISKVDISKTSLICLILTVWFFFSKWQLLDNTCLTRCYSAPSKPNLFPFLHPLPSSPSSIASSSWFIKTIQINPEKRYKIYSTFNPKSVFSSVPYSSIFIVILCFVPSFFFETATTRTYKYSPKSKPFSQLLIQ